MTQPTNNGSSAQGTDATGTINYTYKVFGYAADGTHSQASANIVIPRGSVPLSGAQFNRITWNTVTPTPNHWEVYRTAIGAGGSPTTTGKIGGNIAAGTLTLDDTALAATPPVTSSVATNFYQIVADNNVDYTTPSTTYSQTSVSFWIKSPLTPTALTDIVNSGNSDFNIQVTTANKISVSMKGSGGVLTATTSTTPINNGSWHNVVVLLDNSTAGNTPATISTTTVPNSSDNIRIYMDGTQVACSFTVVSRTGPFKFTSTKPKVGSINFVGNIDDVRIYSRLLALTPTNEITAIVSGHAQ